MSIKDWAFKLSLFLRRRRFEQELDEDVRMHLEMAAEENRCRGMSPEEARLAARRSFGAIEQVKEECRNTRVLGWADGLSRDVRLSYRHLIRNPVVTAVAILALVLGIGANSAVFSVADPLLLRHLPVPDPEQLVLFRGLNRNRPDDVNDTVPYEFAQRFQRESRLAESFISFGPLDAGMMIEGEIENDRAEQISIEPVSASYFDALGLEAIAGRLFSESDDSPGAQPVAIISERLLQRRFGGDPGSAVGVRIRLDELLANSRTDFYTIIGVVPSRFQGIEADSNSDVWVPFHVYADSNNSLRLMLTRSPAFFAARMMARLKPDVSLDLVQAETDVILARLPNADPAAGRTVEVHSGTRGFSEFRFSFSEPLLILVGIVAVVLLIACGNVAALLLARNASRRKEFAVRLAIGSGRAGIVRQLLVEAGLIAIVGGLFSLAVAYWGAQALLSYLPPESGFTTKVSLNLRVVCFTAGMSVVSLLLFGLVPALRTSQLAGIFGLLALLLALIGVYGVVSYGIMQRTGEIGIRLALGAQSRNVIGMLMRRTMVLVGVGVILGLFAALTTTHVLSSLLFGLTPTDPRSMAAAILVLAACAALAAYLPIRRASRLDPLAALRHE